MTGIIIYLLIGVVLSIWCVVLTNIIQMTFHNFPIAGKLFTSLAVILLWPIVLYMVIMTWINHPNEE